MKSALMAVMLPAMVATADATQSWRMLDQYPRQYVAKKLAAHEMIEIDGRLDDPAWQSADW